MIFLLVLWYKNKVKACFFRTKSYVNKKSKSYVCKKIQIEFISYKIKMI